MKPALAAVILVLSLAAPVAAGPLEDAAAAYDRGDDATALRLWRPLADQGGNAIAQYNLGLMYAQGRGVPENQAEALKWFRLAADRGNIDAQTRLGLMYRFGQAVPQDYVRAHMWFSLAAVQGGVSGQAPAREISKLMTPAQIAEAQKLAHEWRPAP
jgi:TPR repeat protein